MQRELATFQFLVLVNFFLLHCSRCIYEGRSINKLQNGAIPSVLKIGKIRNIRFVGNVNLNIHTRYNFSRWWRHYCDVIWQ